MRYRALAAGGAVLAASGLAFGSAEAHAATKPTATATTTLHARPDSGYAGNTWANDAMTRVATVTYVGKDTTPTDCGTGAANCYTWTGTISDKGTAYAITGATSPGAQAVPIKGTPRAAITGGTDVTFHASSSVAKASLVPKAVTGGNGMSTTNWVEQFFAKGTTFGSGPILPNWRWRYVDSQDCQQWVDAYNVTKANSGDITGVDGCPVISGGHAVSVSRTQAVIAWKQTVNHTANVVINGPGPINGHVGHVTVSQASYSGLEAGHTYVVTIQPTIKGAPAGKAGRVSFVTAK